MAGNFKKYFIIIIFFFVLSQSGYTQNILKGPYLIEPGENTMCIRWETDSKIQCSVRFGSESNLDKEIMGIIRGVNYDGYLYEAMLEGLSPDSEYFYQVNYGDKKTSKKSFNTNSKHKRYFRFVAMGDSRSNPKIFQKIMDNVKVNEPDLIISMGDLVANGGTYSEWQEYYFSIARNQIDHIPLVSTLGDHEGSGDEGELFRHFLRTEQTTDKQWFSFDYGSAHFISLDYRHPDNKEMIDWFIQDVESSDSRWIFVYMHRPCYNLGGHRSAWGRGTWPDLFRKYKVDIVFAGHSHQYERFYPLRPENRPESKPVTYITTGGAGAGLYDVTQSPYLAKAESVNHFISFRISDDTLHAKAIRNDNTLLDEFTMIKQGDSYHDSYNALVKEQAGIDVLTMFMRSASLSLDTIPLDDHPSRTHFELTSPVDDDLSFTVFLNEISQPFYQMDSVSGTLKGGEMKKFPLSIYSKNMVTVSRWGNITPEIILSVKYKYRSKEYIINGGALEYWPGQDYGDY